MINKEKYVHTVYNQKLRINVTGGFLFLTLTRQCEILVLILFCFFVCLFCAIGSMKCVLYKQKKKRFCFSNDLILALRSSPVVLFFCIAWRVAFFIWFLLWCWSACYGVMVPVRTCPAEQWLANQKTKVQICSHPIGCEGHRATLRFSPIANSIPPKKLWVTDRPGVSGLVVNTAHPLCGACLALFFFMCL